MNDELIAKVGDWCSRFIERVAVVPVFGWVWAMMCLMLYWAWLVLYALVSLIRIVYEIITDK